MPSRIVVKDNGADALLEDLEKVKKKTPSVSVGILGKAAQADHGGMTNGQLAAIHEFGLGNAPARPFLRSFVELRTHEIEERLADVAESFMKRGGSLRRELERFGLWAQGEIVAAVKEGSLGLLPLKPATIKKKTVDGKAGIVPLVNTGQLMSAVTYKVENAD